MRRHGPPPHALSGMSHRPGTKGGSPEVWLGFLGFLLFSVGLVRAQEEPIPLEQPGIVSLGLKDAPALTVFEQIVLNGKYDLVTRGAIDETVTAFLSGVSIQDALDTITQTIGVEYRVVGRIVTLYGQDADSDYTETYIFNIASVGAIGGPGSIIKRLVEGGSDEEAAQSGGGGTGPVVVADGESRGRVIIDSLNNQLVVTTIPSLHRRIKKLVAQLDRVAEDRAGRKSRIYELRYITPDLFRASVLFQFPGFQPGQMLLFSEASQGQGQQAQQQASGGPSTGELEASLKRVIVSDTEENLDRIENLLKAIDKPSRQVFVDVKLMEVDTDLNNNFGAQIRAIHQQNGRTSPVAEFFGNNSAAADSPFRLKFGTLGPEQFEVLFDYLEREDRAHLLSNPKMTVVDGRNAEIRLVTREPYGETTVNQGVVQTAIQFVDVGITLRYQPTIYPDNVIKLALQPEVSDAPSRININNNQVPQVTSTSANTTLMVKNAHTVMIGGIIRADKTENLNTMPILGHIPILGRLFHNTREGHSRLELVIAITPKIVDHNDFNWTSKSRGWQEGNYKYLFHDMRQIVSKILFIDEVMEF